ncbi:MAG: quinolinate synthase NadA [Patescibacteria group bacterium]
MFRNKTLQKRFDTVADIYPGEYGPERVAELTLMLNEAEELLAEKDILLLVHNYQRPELQELGFVAGFVGDSYGLTLKAQGSKAQTVLYCSVEFMARTGKILLPDKTVLIPDRPGCSLVDGVDVGMVKKWREKHPNGKVIAYINTSDAAKAVSDYICTSRNAVVVVEHVRTTFPGAPLYFLPDKYLAANVMAQLGMTERDMDVWEGACHVHKAIGERAFEEALERYPDAELLRHPECGCTSGCIARILAGRMRHVPVLSTEGMVEYARRSPARTFVVGTETGMLYRLRREVPDKQFHPISLQASCEYMKMITIEKLLACLRADDTTPYEVNVVPDIAQPARKAIERMMLIG